MAVDSGNTRSFSFKSVGETASEYEERTQTFTGEKPIGIKTPVRLGVDNSGLLQMHKEMASQISDNLRNLIATQHGERFGLHDFGGNLKELAFELSTGKSEVEAMRRIRKTVLKYMPYVELDQFETFTMGSDNSSVAQVGVRLYYKIPSLNISNKAIDVVIYTSG